jgi:gamma-glutamylcyclotransferase (GGCT)/AIG2-like uncharacterized protein YtfP
MNLDLPLFVYGALKSGEFAHRIVKPFLVSEPERADAKGFELHVLDGVANAVPNANSYVEGELLTFADPQAAYRKIEEFEDVPNFYVWSETEANGGKANILVSANPNSKSRHEQVNKWTSAQDGLLGYGIPWSYERLEKLVPRLRDGSQDYEFWLAYHDLQSTLQLLWSITERVLLFHDGPVGRDRTLGDKVGWLKQMRKHPDLAAAVEAARIEHQMGVRSNRSPSRPEPFRAGEFGFEAWYEMRNNVVHRGKGTRLEKGPLKTATIDLHNTLAIYLQNNSTPIRKLWLELTGAQREAYSGQLYQIRR